MKYKTKVKILSGFIIVTTLLPLLSLVRCENGTKETPQPTAQSKDITLTDSKKVTVTPDGTGGFVAGAVGSKSVIVSESWLSGADETDILSIYGIFAQWISMNKSNVRIASVQVPQYNRAIQIHDNRIASKMVRQRIGLTDLFQTSGIEFIISIKK